LTAPTTVLIDALKTHLQGITAANGYAVTVASVSTGRSALAGDSSGPYPAITLTPLRDDPGESAAPQRRFQQWTRTVALEAVIQENTAWDAEMDVLWDAIRHRLTTFTAAPLNYGAVEFAGPDDLGGQLASLRFLTTLLYRLTLKES